MNFRLKALLCAAFLAATVAPTAASVASENSRFTAAVARVLSGLKNDFFDEWTAAEKREFIACAQGIMASVPQGRKRYVLQARNQSEQRQRFDEIAQDNNAAVKQKIARDCS